jgi:hypothetical protein
MHIKPPMNKIILCYDVSGHQTEVKAQLESYGYSDRWKQGKDVIYLPDTTVWKKDTTTVQTIKDLDTAIANVNATLSVFDKIKRKRAVAFEFTDWWAYFGEPHVAGKPAPEI